LLAPDVAVGFSLLAPGVAEVQLVSTRCSSGF